MMFCVPPLIFATFSSGPSPSPCPDIHSPTPSGAVSSSTKVKLPQGRICKDRGMTPPLIDRWVSIIETGRTDDLDALLADDAVFYSPAVFTPQKGKALTSKYLKAAAKLFDDTDFHYVEQWHSERSAILEFVATVNGIHVNGIDMIHWND